MSHSRRVSRQAVLIRLMPTKQCNIILGQPSPGIQRQKTTSTQEEMRTAEAFHLPE